MLKKFRIKVNGKEYIVEMEDLNPEVQFQDSNPSSQSSSSQTPVESAVVSQDTANTNNQTQTTSIPGAPKAGEPSTAPMPGTILNIFVKEGDIVTENQPILVLEAMKMENQIVAPKKGTVTSLLVQKGQAVDVGTVLFTVE